MALTYTITAAVPTGESLHIQFTAQDASVAYSQAFDETLQDMTIASITADQLNQLIEGFVKPFYDAAVEAAALQALIGVPQPLAG